jgi:hypothetical protein
VGLIFPALQTPSNSPFVKGKKPKLPLRARLIVSLYETPRWYHGLCANRTTAFYRLPSTRIRFDWRVLANGKLDQALHEDGRLDQTLPGNAFSMVKN